MGGKLKGCNDIVILFVMLMVSNNLLLPVMSTKDSNPLSHQGSSTTSQSNCLTPTPKPPSHGGGGGGCRCPSPPHGGSGGGFTPASPPLVPSPPISSGGGGYYGPPPTPATPIVPSPPLVPSPPPPVVVVVAPSYDPYTPPLVPSPPVYPITPPTPTTVPIQPPFPCTYWGTHPTLIFGIVGWWATLGGLFGVATLPRLNGANISLQQILTSTSRDPYSSLYKEATASFLNSLATKHFPYSTNQVKSSFIAALATAKAAAAQARLFRLANEGRIKQFIPSSTTN